MKRLNKVLSAILIFTLVMTVSNSSFAQAKELSNFISAEDYFLAIQEEYEKYHIKFEVTGYDADSVYTLQALDEKIEEIRLQMSRVTNYSEELQTFVEVIPELEDNGIATRAPMLINKVYSQTRRVNSPSGVGMADLLVEIEVTQDGQYNVFTSVNGITSRQQGLAVNFESWEQHDGYESNIWKDEYGSHMECYATGTLVVSYTEPNTNMKMTYSSDHTIGGGASLWKTY